MIKSYLLKTVNKYLDKYFEAINPKDIDYGLLNGEVTLKNTLFKESCLNNFMLKDSKIQEISIKYNWSLLGRASINLLIKGMCINMQHESFENKSQDDIQDTSSIDSLKEANINIEISNTVVKYCSITMRIDKIAFTTTEIPYRKNIKIESIAVLESGIEILRIPTIEMEMDLKRISLSVLVRRIYIKINTRAINTILSYKDRFISDKKDSRVAVKIICNLHTVVVDLTEIRKRVIFNTLSLSASNKYKIWIEKISVRALSRKKAFAIKDSKCLRNEILVSRICGDQSFCKIERCYVDANETMAFVAFYRNIVYKKKKNSENIVLIISQLTVLLDGMEFCTSNSRFSSQKDPNRLTLTTESVSINDLATKRDIATKRDLATKRDIATKRDLVKIDFIKIDLKDLVKTETGDILVDIEGVNLEKINKIYKKYCGGEDNLNITFEQYITSLKIVYDNQETLFDTDGIILKYNSTKSPMLSISSESLWTVELCRIRNQFVCSFTDLYLDLKSIDRLNHKYVLPRMAEIRKLLVSRNSLQSENSVRYIFYNTNIAYEDLKLNVEFLEYSSSYLKTIFNITLEDDKYLIVDRGHLKIQLDDILLIRTTENLRINVTNHIIQRLSRFKDDIKNSIMVFIMDEEPAAGFCWILDSEGVSLNIFDDDLREIAAVYLMETKIGNLRESDVIRKLYFRVKDIQIDNQTLKNIYPVILHKTKGNDCVECSVLYYYNSSTLFIKKTNISFGEISLNLEETHLESILKIFKPLFSKKEENNPHFEADSCITIKDFEIGELSMKVNCIKKKGGDFKGRVLFFVMNNISDFNLVVQRITIQNHRTDIKKIVGVLIEYYKSQIYNNMFKVFGHLDFLGNVGALSSTISGTIKENVKKKTGFFKGSKNLLVNTLCGVSTTLGKISKSVKNNAGLLTFDKDFSDSTEYHPYQQDAWLSIPIKKNDIKSIELLMKGTEKLFHSVYSGLVGVARKPIQGSQDGVSGILLGLGKGMIGAISKPVVGVSELVSNCTEIISNSSGLGTRRRVLYPLYTEGSIGNYDLDVSASYYFFSAYLKQKNEEEFIDGSFGYFEGEAILVLTNKRLIISTDTGVREIEFLDISIDSREKHLFKVENIEKTKSLEVSANRCQFVESLLKILM
ncbi:Vacuolar protein sorting-associated protein 13a [Nosema granulosis]|uniref:Vacuolar protein sorting-associated protein 13a n=1 Tax=Nosema granulosis TaxID=83296 RepID=A0A9P6L0B8_9MICR|nr:Vacuolar protein sorting-associated protein 13a [Nosema granulosis]